EPSYDILKEIDDNLGGSDTEIPMPFIDTTPIIPSDVKRYIEQALEISKNKAEETDVAQNQIAEDKVAWQDSDDEKVCASLQNSSDYKPPEELEIRNEPDKHNESNKKKMSIIKYSEKQLSKFEVTKMKHVNQQAYSQSAIHSVAFHPNAQVARSVGLDKIIRLFQIDDKINPKKSNLLYLKIYLFIEQHSIQMGLKIFLLDGKNIFTHFNIEAGSIDKSNGIYEFQDKSFRKFFNLSFVDNILFLLVIVDIWFWSAIELSNG
ncbi:26552_t:CDS:2, partial [Gigaspora margarita]